MSFALRTRERSPRWCRAAGEPLCAPPRPRRWPRGCRGRPGSGSVPVVLSFPVGSSDRVDRRKIEHVETHPCDLRKEPFAIPERAVPPRLLARGAGKELVPGAEQFLLPVDRDGKFLARGGKASIAMGVEQPGGFAVQAQGDFKVNIPFPLDRGDHRPQPCCIFSRTCVRSLFQVPDAYDEFHVQSLAGVELFLQLPLPGTEVIDPAAYRVMIQTDAFQRKLPFPPVVTERLHGLFMPGVLPVPPVENRRCQLIMAIAYHVRPNDHLVADNPLHRISTAVDLGIHILDNDSFSSFHGKGLPLPGFRLWVNCTGAGEIGNRGPVPRHEGTRPEHTLDGLMGGGNYQQAGLIPVMMHKDGMDGRRWCSTQRLQWLI